jgi:hypothetical protein
MTVVLHPFAACGNGAADGLQDALLAGLAWVSTHGEFGRPQHGQKGRGGPSKLAPSIVPEPVGF